MIKVYVREITQLEGKFLGEFEPAVIYQLPELFKTYDVYVDDEAEFKSAQFVSNASGVFFEITVEVPPE